MPENVAAVHLGFSDFTHGSPAENLTAVLLDFSNFMHGCRARRHCERETQKTTTKKQRQRGARGTEAKVKGWELNDFVVHLR